MRKLIICGYLLLVFTVLISPPASAREGVIGDYYENGDNFYGDGVTPSLGQDIFLFGDLPWDKFGISDKGKIPQWLGYGSARWSFMTATGTQLSVQGKVMAAGVSVCDIVSNILFEATKAATLLGNIIVLACFKDLIGDCFPSMVSSSVKALYGSGVSDIGSDAYPLWQMAMGFAMVGLGLTISINFFRAQLVEGIKNYTLAILVMTGLLVYFAHIDTIMPALNQIMDEGTATVVVKTYQTILHSSDPDSGSAGYESSIIGVTELSWEMFVGRPWVLAQWGTAEFSGDGQDSLKLSGEEIDRIQSQSVLDVLGSIFKSGDVSKGTTGVKIPEDAQYIDKVYLGGNESIKEKLLETVQNRDSVVHTACGEELSSAFRHLEWALISIFPAVAYCILTIFVGIPVFVAQMLLAIMIVFLPVVLIMGISGDGGRRMMISYAKITLGLIATKIVYGLYLALTLALIDIIWDQFSGGKLLHSFGLAYFLISIIIIYAIKKRQTVMQMVMGAVSGAPPAAEKLSGEFLASNLVRLLGSGIRFKRKYEEHEAITNLGSYGYRGNGEVPPAGDDDESRDSRLSSRELSRRLGAEQSPDQEFSPVIPISTDHMNVSAREIPYPQLLNPGPQNQASDYFEPVHDRGTLSGTPGLYQQQAYAGSPMVFEGRQMNGQAAINYVAAGPLSEEGFKYQQVDRNGHVNQGPQGGVFAAGFGSTGEFLPQGTGESGPGRADQVSNPHAHIYTDQAAGWGVVRVAEPHRGEGFRPVQHYDPGEAGGSYPDETRTAYDPVDQESPHDNLDSPVSRWGQRRDTRTDKGKLDNNQDWGMDPEYT